MKRALQRTSTTPRSGEASQRSCTFCALLAPLLAALVACDEPPAIPPEHDRAQIQAKVQAQALPPTLSTSLAVPPAPSSIALRSPLAIASGPPERETETVAAAPSRPKTENEMSLAPRDECAALPGWHAFRARLAEAVNIRDAAAFVELVAPDIRLDFGGGAGRAELRARLEDPAQHLWDELNEVLPLGCAMKDELVVIPWFFWNVPEDIDPAPSMVVIGSDVPLRSGPSGDAAVRARLDWALVATKPRLGKAAPFTAITTRGGMTGYVATRSLRSVLDYRLIAERRGESWQITAFVAGD